MEATVRWGGCNITLRVGEHVRLYGDLYRIDWRPENGGVVATLIRKSEDGPTDRRHGVKPYELVVNA